MIFRHGLKIRLLKHLNVSGKTVMPRAPLFKGG